MNDRVALIIIFNHRYDKNIEVLEKMYGSRFSNIFFIVPFYDGTKSNIIPVYEHSYRFQGYITQAFDKFFNEKFEHYFFIGDDLILNPVINENNYREHLNLTAKDSFLSEIITLHERPENEYWPRIKQAYDYNPKLPGCEITNELPSYDEAIELFKNAGQSVNPLTFQQIYDKKRFSLTGLTQKGYLKHLLRQTKHNKTAFKLKYPLVGAYSDILVVSNVAIKKFARYCGIFAASNLFVEIAIPTALILSTPDIKLEKDIKLQGRALWTEKDLEILTPYSNILANLTNSFPENYLYIHPVKLSKWK